MLGDEKRAVSIRDVASVGDAVAAFSFFIRRVKGDPPKESFTNSVLFPRTESSEGPTTAQPQERASTPAIRKLS